MKIKINNWDLIKFTNFCLAKESINKMRRQPAEWEKIIANETTDKGLSSKMNNTSSSYNSITEKETTKLTSGKKT